MKRLFVVLLIFAFSLSLYADVYRYTDSSGKVYLVDSIYQVPPEYRAKVEVLPSGKEVSKEEKVFENLFVLEKKGFKIGDAYRNFVFEKIRPYLMINLFLLIICLALSFAKRDLFLSIIVWLAFFLVFEFLFLFYIYPDTVKATKVYSYLAARYIGRELSVADRVKKQSLEGLIIYRPVDLNPYSLYKRVDKLAEFYNEANFSVLKRVR